MYTASPAPAPAAAAASPAPSSPPWPVASPSISSGSFTAGATSKASHREWLLPVSPCRALRQVPRYSTSYGSFPHIPEGRFLANFASTAPQGLFQHPVSYGHALSTEVYISALGQERAFLGCSISALDVVMVPYICYLHIVQSSIYFFLTNSSFLQSCYT